MFHFLHTNIPEPVFFSIGPIHIYWYGICIVSGLIAAIFAATILCKYYEIDKNDIIDLAFYTILFGIIGARLYDVFLELPFYIQNPLDVFKVWQGGLAIHGGLIFGTITIYVFAKRHKLNIYKLLAVSLTVLPLGQAIGRNGNYFNQELFRKPTTLPWGIPISEAHRVAGYTEYGFFHPTFIYESLGTLAIFLILLSFNVYFIKRKKITRNFAVFVIAAYFILYSILRFSLEFVRIDTTPVFFNLRFPQIASLIIIFLSLVFLFFYHKKGANKSQF